jgi:predicted O-methyltransferase YrrM
MTDNSHVITGTEVENYLYAMLPDRDLVLQKMEREAKEREIPIVGPLVARVLYQYARLIGAKTVFELGSAIGYSTLWWSYAVGQGGTVHYTDGSQANADEARAYFEWAGVADRIKIHIGDALEMLSERNEQFDILFNDVDKRDYPRVLSMAAARVRRGGLFIADNTLRKGRVSYAAGNPQLAEEKPAGDTAAVVEFNRLMYASPDWYTTILPLRDGVSVGFRL